jgi:hypothetical protein
VTFTSPTIHQEKFDALTQAVDDSFKLELIRLTLETGVPFAIHDLQKQGGPDEWHFGEARAFAWDMGAHGDALLYRMKGETARMMDRLIECIAILAFLPGGITTFGLHFEAKESEVTRD